jgi:hypothetical protein
VTTTPAPTNGAILPPPGGVRTGCTTLGHPAECGVAQDDAATTLVDAAPRWHEPPLAASAPRLPTASAPPTPLMPPPGAPSAEDVVTEHLRPRPLPGAAEAEASFSSARSVSASVAQKPVESPQPAEPPPGWVVNARRRRPWPRAVKLAVLAVLFLLVLFVVGGRSAPLPPARSASLAELEGKRAVHDEELRDRKEITPDHFPSSTPMFVPVAPQDQPGESPLSLEPRRRRRADDLEAMRTGGSARARGQRGHQGRRGHTARRSKHSDDEFIIVDWRTDLEETPAAEPRDERAAKERSTKTLIAAGDFVKARLSRPLVLRGASAVVTLDVVNGPLPDGARLVGRASAANDGVVSIRVHTLVLPTKGELRVDAEVFDEGGGVGVAGSVRGGDGSVGATVADGTVRRAARDLLGAGLLGGAADDVLRSRDRDRGSSRRPVTVSVPRGRIVAVLFSRAVMEDRH